MKILILGAFNKGALENYYISGLRSAGAECSFFDIAETYYQSIRDSTVNKIINKIFPDFFFDKINKALFHFISNQQFDVILVFKGLTLYESSIEKLKQHAKILCCYNPDHPFRFYSPGSGNRHIINSIKHYDIYFTYSENICRQLKQEWKSDSYVIPFGFDGSNAPGKDLDNSTYINKWLFIGTWDKYRMNWLSNLSINSLNIYGDAKWAGSNGKNNITANAYQGKPLYDGEYKVAIKNASGIINLLRRQNIEEQSHNMRTFEVPGYGGLMIANRTDEQQSFFEEDKEAVYFDSAEELSDKINFLAKHPSSISSIKAAAFLRASCSGYSYSDRSSEMFRILKNYSK
jgi:spore maturation protein CgeB